MLIGCFHWHQLLAQTVIYQLYFILGNVGLIKRVMLTPQSAVKRDGNLLKTMVAAELICTPRQLYIGGASGVFSYRLRCAKCNAATF